MKQKIMGKYIGLRLSKDNKAFTQYSHRLLAKAFIPNPENKPEIDHINRNKEDNRIENLRWATRSENGRNKNKKEGCKSIYKNVTLFKNGKWTSSITINYHHKRLGYFDTEEEAYNSVLKFINDRNLTEFYNL